MGRAETIIPQNELERQKEFSRGINDLISDRDQGALAFVDTYGCQQNEADSERIRGMLSEMGFGFTDCENDADVIVINTCAVREHAEQRVLGNIGALVHSKRAHPGQVIAVCGCMVAQPHRAKKLRESYRHVDLVFGPDSIWRLPELLHTVMTRRCRVFFDEPEFRDSVAEGLPVLRSGSVKAWVTIMYGCNNFCSYCIVPFVRGRERSRDPKDILEEVGQLAAQGYKDITLLGQNVNSYGAGLGEDIDFSDLLERINSIDGDFLIRFMTSHPKDASRRLFDTMAASEKVARHIHLPVQAGDDRVLAAMNRGYTRESYLELVEYARTVMPDIVLTSDIIVGFPGESDDEFEQTLDVVRRARFDALFTFIYSKRGGTPAEKLPDPYTRRQKQARFDRLIELQNSISAEKHAALVGTKQRVLIDGETGGLPYNLSARTNGGRLVHIKGDTALVGRFMTVEIAGSSTWALTGQVPG